MTRPPDPADVAAAAAPGDKLIGARVAQYRITEYIGAGGMAQVFAAVADDDATDATDAAAQRTAPEVAIKILLKDHCDNPDIINRFINEARALSRIRHPGVVTVYGVETLPSGRVCLIMERLVGTTLQAWHKQRGRVPFAEALPIMLQLTDALAAAHAQRIVHRDIKPDNVFLIPTPQGMQVKILDFGIAKLHEGAGDVQTMTKTAMGTAAYMAPEQFRSAKNVDHRSDIYSLGCVFFETLAGRGPFLAKNLVQFMRMHQSDPVPPLSAYAPDLPPGVEDIVTCMLAKDPDRRFESMAEVKRALERSAGRPVTRMTAQIAAPPPVAQAQRLGLVIAVVVAALVIVACVLLIVSTS